MSLIPSPNLTLTITPPGGVPTDYSGNLAWSGLAAPSLTQNFGRQGDTGSFALVDDYGGKAQPNFFIKPLSQISLFDNTANVSLFTGVVTDVQMDPLVNRNVWTLACTDYTFYADNAIVQGTFVGQTIDQIVVALTQQANCGITALQTGQSNGTTIGYVAPSPLIQSFVLNYSTLSEAWRKLAKLASQTTPFGWYVDQNRNLHFFDQTAAQSSGVSFSTTLSYVGSSTPNLLEGHMQFSNSFAYEWDGASVRNRILVQGATQIVKYGSYRTANPVDQWPTNGVQQSWPLRYTVTGSPVLQVNGTLQPVTLVSAGGSFTGTGWTVQQNYIGSWFLNAPAGGPPGGGQTIKLWYDYQIPIIAQANDIASQQTYTGPNGGVFSEYISDSSLTSVPMAQARAYRQQQEYAFVAERLTFTSSPEWLGWVRAGQTFTMTNSFIPDTRNNYAWGLTNATFIVISNSVQFQQGGYRTCQFKCIRI
jgi:hypothetical protein